MAERNLILFAHYGVIFQGFKELNSDFYLSFFQDDNFTISNEPMVGYTAKFKVQKNTYNVVTDPHMVKLLTAYAKKGEWLYFSEPDCYFFMAAQ